MTWNEIHEIVLQLQNCNQNTPKQTVKDLVNKILEHKKCKKVYIQNGFFCKELSVPVQKHELDIAQMLVGNSLTHEILPLWFRDGYAFQPSVIVTEFLKEKRENL